MNLEKNQIENHNENAKFQHISSLIFEEIKKDSPDVNDTIEILGENKTNEEIEEAIKEELKKKYWWFNEKWTEKGLPEEQIKLRLDNTIIDTYNWGDNLNNEQIEKIKDTLILFCSNSKDTLENTKYILINNTSGGKHKITGDELNGRSPNGDFIELFPNALKDIGHRIKNVSNLEGTIIHELSHKIRLEIRNKWKKKFGKDLSWNEKKQKAEGGALIDWKPYDQFSCISDLACYDFDEDLCESMVGAMKNPSILDKNKMEFLKKNNLISDKNDRQNISIEINRLSENDIKMPNIESPIRYRLIDDELEIY
ncbi:MAG: hypothetical protein KAQ64_00740 [Candidatus Pacebacteria bacterium]|nr:hypothetical protein [Candidatus Paceibacterota bacterium]